MIPSIDAYKIHQLLKMVRESEEAIDIELCSYLLDIAINGDPEKRENAILAILSTIEPKG